MNLTDNYIDNVGFESILSNLNDLDEEIRLDISENNVVQVDYYYYGEIAEIIYDGEC